MARHYGHLKLEELDATSSDMPRGIRVTEVFIPPSVRECEQYLPRAMELPKELQRRLREQEALDGTELEDAELARLLRTYLNHSPQPMLEVLADPSQRKLVVLGDPGSGKSLLLQYMVLAWAEAGDTLLGDAPLPLLIELRDYASRRAKGEVNGILDYQGRAESLRWRLDPEALEHWLRSSVPPSGVNPEDQHRRSRCWRFASEIPCGAMGGPVCDPGLSTTSNLRTRPCPFLILPPLSWSSCLAVALPANSSLNWCARACRP
jgi:hypothetical protein